MDYKGLSRRNFLQMMAGGTAAVFAAAVTPLAALAQDGMMYNEAPMLADLVASGDLPPVDQRIPTNPRVITPYNEIGEYGGTWRRAFKGLSDRWGPTKLQEEMLIEWNAPDPDSLNLEANYISSWEQNDDATEFTFTLREGLKWSDGAPFTTVDVQFCYDLMSAEPPVLNPPAHMVIGGELMQLEIIDELSWKITFNEPNPLLPITLARTSAGGPTGGPTMAAPKHYLEQYWADSPNANQELIDAAIEASGLSIWQELWPADGGGQGPIPFWFLNPDLPVINAWRSVNSPQQDPYLMERNPFYHAVDTEGNQLPYIDGISHRFFESNESLNLWIAQGEIDMQTRHLTVADFTFYKENEEVGDYRVALWKAAWTHTFHPNISHPDPQIAELLDTAEFREALSISINRQEMNDLVYNGLLEPRQASPVSGALEYSAEFESRWIEYDPDRANELLDSIGLAERNSDGWRTYSNGDDLTLTILWSESGFAGSGDEIDLVIRYWQDIGLNIRQELVERSLFEVRLQEGVHEISVWNVDRSAVVIADPRWYIGGDFALNYRNWIAANINGETVTGAQIEPPEDHPIRQINDLWQQIKVEPNDDRRNQLFNDLFAIHIEHPYMIGTLGEDPVPVVVKNNFGNVNDGFIYDDALRSQGLIMPAQLFIRSS